MDNKSDKSSKDDTNLSKTGGSLSHSIDSTQETPRPATPPPTHSEWEKDIKGNPVKAMQKVTRSAGVLVTGNDDASASSSAGGGFTPVDDDLLFEQQRSDARAGYTLDRQDLNLPVIEHVPVPETDPTPKSDDLHSSHGGGFTQMEEPLLLERQRSDEDAGYILDRKNLNLPKEE